MTHTIHPKMLEKVAQSIANILAPMEGDIPYAADMDAAQAAILAMWEGLPMEETE